MSLITLNSQYTGKLNPEMFFPCVANNVTFATDIVRLHPGINGRMVLPKGTANVVIQDQTTAFVPQTNIIQNLSDSILEPRRLSVMTSLPKNEVLESYRNDMVAPGTGMNNTSLDEYSRRLIYDQIKYYTGSYVEQIIWQNRLFNQANLTATGLRAGVIEQIQADPLSRKSGGPANSRYTATNFNPTTKVLTLSSTTGLEDGDVITITSSDVATTDNSYNWVGKQYSITVLDATTISLQAYNTEVLPDFAGGGAGTYTFMTLNQASIFAAFKSVLKNLPYNVKYAVTARQARMVWVVSPNVGDAWQTFLVNNGNAVNYINLDPTIDAMAKMYQAGAFSAFGFDVVVIPNLQPNTIALYPTDSVHVGMDIETEFSNMVLIDMSQQSAENEYRGRMDFAMDYIIMYPEQISLVAPVLAA